jgi:hypothetical protein
MSENERKQWQKQYDDICREIELIKKRLGLNVWNEEKAINLLLDINKEIGKSIWDKKNDKVLLENPLFIKKVNEAGKEINKAFALKSMDAFKEALKKYKDTCTRVNQMCTEQNQFGFREVFDEEAKQIKNPF